MELGTLHTLQDNTQVVAVRTTNSGIEMFYLLRILADRSAPTIQEVRWSKGAILSVLNQYVNHPSRKRGQTLGIKLHPLDDSSWKCKDSETVRVMSPAEEV